jgi:hypothetical protein
MLIIVSGYSLPSTVSLSPSQVVKQTLSKSIPSLLPNRTGFNQCYPRVSGNMLCDTCQDLFRHDNFHWRSRWWWFWRSPSHIWRPEPGGENGGSAAIHHNSLESFARAVDTGCHICTVIAESLQSPIVGSVFRKKPFTYATKSVVFQGPGGIPPVFSLRFMSTDPPTISPVYMFPRRCKLYNSLNFLSFNFFLKPNLMER